MTYCVVLCTIRCTVYFRDMGTQVMTEGESREASNGKLDLELRRGVLVLTVLSQLRTAQYGYSLRQALAGEGMPIEEGTLYPLLRRSVAGPARERMAHRRRASPPLLWADAEERERLGRLRDYHRPGRLNHYPVELTRPKARSDQKRGRSAQTSLDENDDGLDR